MIFNPVKLSERGNCIVKLIEVIGFRVFTSITLVALSTFCYAQPGTVTLGIEYKPIFPVSFLRTGTQSTTDTSNINYSISLKSGFSGGMVIRKSFTRLISFETGINYVKRVYDVSIVDGADAAASGFQIIGYEIPLSMLIYAQTGEKTFMNASMGLSTDMFASNVQTGGDNFRTYTVRSHVFQFSVIANAGWEYRTEKSGSFYLGASFHGPFTSLFISNLFFKKNGYDLPGVAIPLSGSYLTLDLRYFFAPDKSKKKKSSDDEDN